MADASSKGAGLLGRLLLPSYTDAGANTSFQPPAAAVAFRGGGSASTDPTTSSSEAATEIRDNRSSVKQQFRINSSRYHHHGVIPSSSNHSSTSSASSSAPQQQQQQQLPVSQRYNYKLAGVSAESSTTSNLIPPSQVGSGFFPSTKPQLSPRAPPSPPSVTRQQLPVVSTTMIPETGATTTLEKENQRRIVYVWDNEDAQKKKSAGTSSSSSWPLNAANLQRAAAAAAQRGKSQSPTTTDDSSSSTNGRGHPNRNTSLLADDDGGSDVMSTASEMGTVIEIGHAARRMAEIDAMAALIEASPIPADSLTPRPESFPPAPSRTPNRRRGPDTISNLALPELGEASSWPDGNDPPSTMTMMLAPQTKHTPTTAAVLAGEPIKKEPPTVSTAAAASSNPTPAEMLAFALRRIGTGLNKTKASLSAPPTPRTPSMPPTPRLEELLRSTLTPRGSEVEGDQQEDLLPASLVLRSPGSSARVSLRQRSSQQQQQQQESILAPRFSPSTLDPRLMLRSSTSFNSAVDSNRSETFSSLPSSIPSLNKRELAGNTEALKLTSPFRLAQKCFSYDNTDLGDNDETGSATSSHILNLEASFPKKRTEYSSRLHQQQVMESAASWDVDGAFRAQPHRSYRIGGLRATASQLEHNAQRARVHSDFSPLHVKTGRNNNETDEASPTTLELKTPQRMPVDVEREDALDILACLVERGVTAWNDEVENDGANTAAALFKDISTESSSPSREVLIAGMIHELQSSSKDDGDKEKEAKISALEDLLKSHSYALEMKRAALSASTWLKSIGRGGMVLDGAITSSGAVGAAVVSKAVSEVGQAAGEDAASDHVSDTSISAASAVDTKMELLTLKARLHSAENELKEKIIMNQKLDEELSKCRAEIGRLHTASRNELVITQNRSVLDDDPDDSATASTGGTTPPRKDPAPDTPSPKDRDDSPGDGDNKLFDESFQGNNSLFQDVSMTDDRNQSQGSENLNILVLKTALEQANETIRLLHEKLHTGKTEEERDEAPTVEIPETSVSMTTDKNLPAKQDSPSSGDEHRTINVRMLDGENFVTEWDDLTTPLPPPPDHGLWSPIVHAVLQQWTDDRGLHESLLAWMERVMTGDNLEDSVPPLTISSLDHQVRDGFTMHVLPLLLRRADIHVSVQMRAHRRTSYDLAVSVSQKRRISNGPLVDPRSPSLLDQHGNEDWDDNYDQLVSSDSGAHSATTAPINNIPFRGSNPSHDEDAEYSHFGIPHAASGDMEDIPQSTFMGALGGAIGGLLSRGKYTAVQSPSRFHTNASPSGFPPPAIRATLDAANFSSSQSGNAVPPGALMAELDHQPYHRVVSAPPGRIGITFVEYRGHAMVADVAPDSPLASWVFPSDVLIAVDEVPVSGMRVRDIIKVLTNRKDRQRALRVISSHDMNEFTLNQSAHNDEEP